MFSSRTSKIFNLFQQKEQEKDETITNRIPCTNKEIIITKDTLLIKECGFINKAFIGEEEKVLTQTVHDAHHLEITHPSGHCLKDDQSENDNDSIRDPNYEALSDESSSLDYEATFSKHVVGDSDHVVADRNVTETPLENNVNEARPKKGRKEKFENQNKVFDNFYRPSLSKLTLR
ncbi:hypothetical protein FQA39_LY10560 [Lamprigera yunnana]|nr:hypothetical protein FQA39_LY10560 [Lamprigera yunnana]